MNSSLGETKDASLVPTNISFSPINFYFLRGYLLDTPYDTLPESGLFQYSILFLTCEIKQHL